MSSNTTSGTDSAGRKGSLGLWIGLLALIAAGVALAWFGTESVRKRVVQVDTVQAGTGPTVNPEDGVMMEYEGRIVGGKTFDSSAGRGPATFIAGQTIPGFTQALSKMQRGGRYKARIPGRLAYGATPPPGSDIPPNADLEFDIHIVNIIPNAAAMMGAMQPQQ